MIQPVRVRVEWFVFLSSLYRESVQTNEGALGQIKKGAGSKEK